MNFKYSQEDHSYFLPLNFHLSIYASRGQLINIYYNQFVSSVSLMEYKGLYPKDFYLTNKTLNHLSVLGDKQLYVVILFAWTILRRKTDQIWWHHSFYGWPLNVYCIHNSLHVRFISARQLSTQNRVFILICKWCNQTRFIKCSVARYS